MVDPADPTVLAAGEPDRGDGDAVDQLVLEACVVAGWADGSLAVTERNQVTHLIDTLAADEAARERMRRVVMADLDRGSVLARIAGQPDDVKRRVFDRCLAMLAADRKLTRREGRFVRDLRRACGVGRLRAYSAVRRRFPAFRWRDVGVVVLLIAAAALVVSRLPRSSTAPPTSRVHPPVVLETATAQPAELAPEALFAAVRPAVVTVVVRHDHEPVSTGSGAAIGVMPAGAAAVITNRHVVDMPLTDGSRFDLEVALADGPRLDARLDFVSRRSDLALLSVDGGAQWLRRLELAPRTTLQVGHTVYAVGSPLGLRTTFTSGVVSGFRGAWIQTDATVHSGSSGGPLLDRRGRLCGIITQAHSAKDFAFALPADAVVALLQERQEAEAGG